MLVCAQAVYSDIKAWLRAGAWFLTGTLITGVCVMLAVRSWGVEDFYDATIAFNLGYVTTGFSLPTFLGNVLDRVRSDKGLWILAISLLAWVWPMPKLSRKTMRQHFGVLLVFICLMLSFGLTLVGYPTRYYAIEYLPYLVILAAVELLCLRKAYDQLGYRSRKAILGLGILLLVTFSTSYIMGSWHDIYTWYKSARSAGFSVETMADFIVSREVRSLTDADDTIFVYGNRAWIYVLSGRFAPWPHYIGGGLFRTNFLSEKEFESYMTQMNDAPPKVIVYWYNYLSRKDFPHRSDYWADVYTSQFDSFVRPNYTLDSEVVDVWTSSNEVVQIFVLR